MSMKFVQIFIETDEVIVFHRLIGSLELLGSPGSLVERVGSGLKDFVVYPYQGIFQGPTGFLTGLGHGVGSLAQSITSGERNLHIFMYKMQKNS